MKKTYISPAVVTFQMTTRDGILYTVSGENSILGDGGTTSGTGIEEGSTKSNDWNIWDE